MKRNPQSQSNNRKRGHFVHFLAYGTSLSPLPRFLLYVAVALLSMLSLWLPAGLFLMLSPITFTSTWSLILPGTAAGHVVNLESVGQASMSANSAYSSHSVDPRVNYKALINSVPVRSVAAESVGLSIDGFGKPRVKLLDQTAMMDFRVTGATAEQAYQKSVAIYDALLGELERLRKDEIDLREQGVHKILKGFSEKLHHAQEQILEHQARTHVVSAEQFTEMTVGLERLRARLRDLSVERAGLQGRMEGLRATLRLESKDAAVLLLLFRDSLLLKLAERWSESYTELAQYKAKWGRMHQRVVAAREQEKMLKSELHLRVIKLVPDMHIEKWETLLSAYTETSLLTRMVELSIELNGLSYQITDLNNIINQQQLKLATVASDASSLKDLERKHQVATAVFATALAKLDLGKSDRFSSYPMVQLLARPSKPANADTMTRDLTLLGVAVGSLLIIVGLVLLWIRKPSLQRLLKNA